MKILAIGDPHGNLEKIKNMPFEGVNLILLTGDLGSANFMRKMAFENIERQKKGLAKKEFTPAQEKRAFMEAYSSSMRVVKFLAKKAPVYTIYGNVESSNSQTRKLEKEIGLKLPYLTNDLLAIPNVKIINNKLAKIKGIRIGGLEYFVDVNWVEEFKPKDFKKRMKHAKSDTDKAKKILRKFGSIDILVHHQPPYGLCDIMFDGKHVGTPTSRTYVEESSGLKLVLSGHIHEAGPTANNPKRVNGISGIDKGNGNKTIVINPGNLGRFGMLNHRTLDPTIEFDYGTFARVDIEDDGTPVRVIQYSVKESPKGIGQVRQIGDFSLK